MLIDLMNQKMQKENMSERELARRMNVAPTTIARLKKGEFIDLETMYKICNWLGVNVASALNERGITDDALAAKMSLLIEANPDLRGLFTDMMRDFAESDLSVEDVREIIQYATYRISSKQKASTNILSRPIQGSS